jgi:hypothetical protein
MKRSIGIYVLIAVVAFGAGYWTGSWQSQYGETGNPSHMKSSSLSSPNQLTLEVATDTLTDPGSEIPPIPVENHTQPNPIESVPNEPPTPSVSTPEPEEEVKSIEKRQKEPDNQLSPVLAVTDTAETERVTTHSHGSRPETNGVSSDSLESKTAANQCDSRLKAPQENAFQPAPSANRKQSYPKDSAEHRKMMAARKQLGRKLKLWLKDHPIFNTTESPRRPSTFSVSQSRQPLMDSERQRSGSRGRRWGIGLASGLLHSSVAETPLSSGITSELNVKIAISPQLSLVGDVGAGSVSDGQKYSQLAMQLWGIDLGVNYKVMKTGRISSFLQTKVGLLHCSPTLTSRERLNPASMGMLSLGSGFEVDIHANWSLYLTAEYRHAFGSVVSESGQDAHTSFLAGFTFYPGGSQDKTQVKLLALKE